MTAARFGCEQLRLIEQVGEGLVAEWQAQDGALEGLVFLPAHRQLLERGELVLEARREIIRHVHVLLGTTMLLNGLIQRGGSGVGVVESTGGLLL